jgi:hypothetical protein
MEKLDPKSEEKIDKLTENIVEGVERTLNELGTKLPDQIDAMSPKQLRRALKATVNYIYKKDPDVDLKTMAKREQDFLGGMFSLVEAGASYTMHILGELQREQDNKAREAAKGAENE